MNDEDYESLKGQVNEEGAQFDHQFYKRVVEKPLVHDGVISIPQENNMREAFGNDLFDAYKGQVAENAAAAKPDDVNTRKKLVNLSDIIRKRQEAQGKTAEDGGHVSEIGTQGAVASNNGGIKVTDEGGHVTTFSTKDEAKEYYLKILRTRLEKIAKKYGIVFDPEFVAFFEKDEFFLNGKVPSLEEYADLEKIDKAWQTADVINDLPDEVDKAHEEAYKSMKELKETALRFGNAALYQSIMDDSEKLDEFLKRAKANALKDQKDFNMQKIKQTVEIAILCIVSHEVERYPQMTELIDVLKDTINKRTQYMAKETELKKSERDLRTKAVEAGTVEAAATYRDQCDRVVDLLSQRRDERENLVFSSSPAKLAMNQEAPIIATANPVTNFVETVEPPAVEMEKGRQMVLRPAKYNPINTDMAA